MKIPCLPISLQFHRPEILKSEKHPQLKTLFHKKKDDALNPTLAASLEKQELKQQSRLHRQRILGGLITYTPNSGASVSFNGDTKGVGEAAHIDKSQITKLVIQDWMKGYLKDEEFENWVTGILTNDEVLALAIKSKSIREGSASAVSNNASGSGHVDLHSGRITDEVPPSPITDESPLPSDNKAGGSGSSNNASGSGHTDKKSLARFTIRDWYKGRITDDELIERFQAIADELMSAWPKNIDAKKATHNPDAFDTKAKELHQDKMALFVCANEKGKLETAMKCMNILHGKRGHNENAVSVAGALLEDEGIKKALRKNVDFPFRPKKIKDNILNAAKWHGLADRKIPVGILATPRNLSKEERAEYIDSRSPLSEEIYREYGLPGKEVGELIRHTRSHGKTSAERPLEAQFLDVVDRMSALLAKPFFKKNPERIMPTIFDSFVMEKADVPNDKAYIDPDLKNAIDAAVANGLLQKLSLIERKPDGYVRP